ncbi:MAG: ribosomal protein S18-alanine N-acetyltransferase [Hyphomicrobiaceae bacterium]|nr:ribosomal protein S18-alanine N-acetyltransferase [Hyphomicrobiaceae bacterium]
MSAVDYRRTSLLWAAPEHAAELAGIHAQLFPQGWTAEAFERLLAHPGSIALLARVGTPPQTVGFVLAQMAADEAEILTLGVGAEHQRHGVGQRLVEAICRAARKSEVRRLFLEVAEANAAARALYRKLGFKEVGERKGYYQPPGGPPENATVMALDL